MKLERFLDERQPGWTGLETLLREAGPKPERLGPERLRLLGRLYRAAAADLAFARRAFPHDPVTGRLEQLVIDARQAVYSDSGSRRSLRWFLHTGYWQRVLEQPWPLAIAVLLMFGPIALAAVWAMDDPAAALGIVPAEFQGAAEPGGVGAGPLSAGDLSAFSVEIFTNNIRVTFLVVAGGIFGGLGTAAVTIYNGGFLGAILGLTIENGSSGELLRLVLPHGLLELSCIVVAACAGLRIGWALVEPGTLTRGQSLRRAAGPAMEIVLGTMPWLVLAGLVEGFVSGKVGSLGGAIAVGVGLAVLYWSLVAWRGRPGSEPGASLGPEVGVDAGRGQSSRGRLDHAGSGALEPVGHARAGG